MPPHPSDHPLDAEKALLIQELSEVRSRLAAREKQCRELTEDIARLKSRRPDGGEPTERTADSKDSEPMRAEAALVESRNQYRELVQNANSAIIRWNRDGVITFFNEYAQAFFGWGAEEAIGRHVSILVPETESTGGDLSDLARDIVEHPERYVNNINENARRDGSRVWMTWTNRAILDEFGEVAEIFAVGSDITDRRQAELALRESEERFRNAFANASIGFAMTTPDGRYIDANASYCRIMGYGIDELWSAKFPRLIHPDDYAENMQLIDRMLAGKIRNFVVENRYCRKDGEAVWLRKSVSIGRTVEGVPRWIIMLVEDVTDRRQAEESLRRSRNDLDRAQEVGQIGSWRLDVQRNLLTWSDENHRIFRVPQGTPLTYETFLRLVHPDDREYVDRKWQQAGLQGAPYDIEHRLVVDGRVKWVREKAFLEFDDAGKLIGGFGITQDITERKQSEEALRASERRYRSLFEAMSEGFALHEVILDAEGKPCDYRFLEVNPAFERLTGLKHDALIGRRVKEVLPDIETHWIEGFGRVALTGEPLNIEEYTRPLKRWYNAFAYQTVPGQFAVVFTDVTERKRAEEALKQLNATLEQRVAERTALAEARTRQLQALAVELTESEERERRRIAQLLHDDLQQVLAAARMQLETACESLPHEPMLANVGRLLEESMNKARRLSHELSPAVLHHSGLIPALKWLIGQLMEKFGLQVRLEADCAPQFEDSPLKAFMFRAVQELLFNVIKHAGVKSAHIALSAADSRLEITVSDQGLGFEARGLDFRDETTGFGLMSIRERARYIGGDLVIESRLKQGSRFTLRLPARLAGADDLKRRAGDREPGAPSGDPAAAAAGAVAGATRVLMVDDHPLIREGLIKLMRSHPGIQVVGEASNGREAVERVRRLKPDLVLMDISMPEMDGITATRNIKAELPKMRIVGLSVHEDPHLAKAMRAAGAEACVSKTASFSELLKAIFRKSIS